MKLFIFVLFLLSSISLAGRFFVQDAKDIQNNTTMDKAEILLVDTSGKIVNRWQNPRFKFTHGPALTKKCLWSPNVGYNPSAIVTKSVPANSITTISCYTLNTDKVIDYNLQQRLVIASTTSTNDAIIVSSASGPYLFKISDDGSKVITDIGKFKQAGSQLIDSATKAGYAFLHLNNQYIQTVGLNNGPNLGIIIVNEKTLKPQRLLTFPSLSPARLFLTSKGIAAIMYGGSVRFVYYLNKNWQTISKYALSGPLLQSTMVFSKATNQFIAFQMNKIFLVNYQGQITQTLNLPENVHDVITIDQYAIALPYFGCGYLYFTDLKTRKTKKIAVGQSIFGIYPEKY